MTFSALTFNWKITVSIPNLNIMKYRYIVVDDESLARRLLISHASKIEVLELAAECASAIEAINTIRKIDVDLIFLDIQMPALSGLDFIKGLRKPPAIILTTAFRDFAVEAFELDVIDYLLKPISFERFLKAVDRFLENKGTELSRNSSVSGPAKTMINIKADRKTFPVALEDIIFIESMDDYVKVHLKEKTLVTNENISSLEDRLSPSDFIRIHRSYLISIRQVDSFNSESIDIGGKTLPFGRVYKQTAHGRLRAMNSIPFID